MTLHVERKRRVLALTLNRPEKRNALSGDMCRAIVEHVDAVQEDSDIGAVLIRASGHVFCSGMDLDEAVSPAGADLGPIHERLFSLGFVSKKPIIMSVNGAALGGGLGLVAQGHVVVAEQGSVFGLPEVHVGLWPLLIYRAVEASIGARRTLALSLTGRNFTAQEALAWGLVHRLCPDDEVCDRGMNTARDIAKLSPHAVAIGMTYAREARDKDWQEAGQLAAEMRDALMVSEDFREGVAAFKQKREPKWPSMPDGFYSER